MDNVLVREKIINTVSEVRQISFKEKKDSSEEMINSFLDAVLELKSYISEKTVKVDYISGLLEEITWFDELDDDCLQLINDVIASSKDLNSSLIRTYVNLNKKYRANGIATKEINQFRNSIDNFKESYEDLESVFFFLPHMPEFQETKKMLSLL